MFLSTGVGDYKSDNSGLVCSKYTLGCEVRLKREKRGKGQRRVEEMGVKRGKIRGMKAKGKG